MKGIVFNLLEQVVSDEYGEDAWDTLLARADVDGSYTSLGSYADEDMAALVAAASQELSVDPDEVVRWFGQRALPLLAQSYPGFFNEHTSTQSFLLTLNNIIHPEVRKLYPGADVPVFHFDLHPSGKRLVMSYESNRGLCAFGEGLIEGAAAHYGEHASIVQPRCTKRGDERCVLEISFSRD